MSFRLFGINVHVQMLFWLITALFASDYVTAGRFDYVAVWIAVVFVSILVHELGHALAVRRHRIEPEIALHGMGGTTSWSGRVALSRGDHIVISLAGPFAGFLFGGLLKLLEHFAPALIARLPGLGHFAFVQLLWVNLGWGAINLLPVLPLDGGHVLEHALGPRRARAAAVISGMVAVAVAVLALKMGQWWIAMLFGFSAVRSFQRFNDEPASARAVPLRRPPPPASAELPPELAALLQTARNALAEDQIERAITIAETVLAAAPLPPRAAVLALEIIGWARLQQDRVPAAAQAIETARSLGEVDVALIAAVLLAKGNLPEARRLLEGARAKGDDRKEVVGPLIQILIQQGEVARAAALAVDIVETLSQDDVRRMGEIALDHRANDWAARLFEASFARAHNSEDAYAAARAHALDGQHDRAVAWLRRAVESGFSDRARAWSDAALEALRSGPELEAVLPRP